MVTNGAAGTRTIWAMHDTQGFGTITPSGCGIYRICLPFDELREHGWQAGYGVTLATYDTAIVVCQRFDRPETGPIVASLKDNGFKVVYEIDDDPFSVDPVNWLAYPAFEREEVLQVIRDCATMADLVTVSTAPLAEVFAKFNPNVVVLPNCIPASLLRMKRRKHKWLTIGWSGGASHSRDLAMIAQAWRDVTDETGVRCHLQGVDYRNIFRGGFEYTDWTPDVRSYYRLLDFDIGLAPIADTPFGRCKSHIKALEYAALGIPVVASDCEAYRDFVIDGVTGFLVDTPDQWRTAMLTLVRDERLRNEMSIQAKEQAARWTIEDNWQRWDSAYAQLLEES